MRHVTNRRDVVHAEPPTSMLHSSVSGLKRPLTSSCWTHISCSRPKSCAPRGHPSFGAPDREPPVLLALPFVALYSCKRERTAQWASRVQRRTACLLAVTTAFSFRRKAVKLSFVKHRDAIILGSLQNRNTTGWSR